MTSALLALALFQPTPPAKPAQPAMRSVQLVFYTTGKSTDGLSKEQLGAYQANHLKFLGSLWESRKALLVGPLDGGDLRGVVVMDVGSRQQAVETLQQDPFVKAGYLTPRAFDWYCMPSTFVKRSAFLDIEPMWFGILKLKPNLAKLPDAENQRIFQGHMANINRMAKEGWLVSAGPTDAGNIRGIFIFKNVSKEKLLEECQRDTAIAEGRLGLTLIRWYTAKNSFELPE